MTVFYLDDILVKGRTSEEHDRNLPNGVISNPRSRATPEKGEKYFSAEVVSAPLHKPPKCQMGVGQKTEESLRGSKDLHPSTISPEYPVLPTANQMRLQIVV